MRGTEHTSTAAIREILQEARVVAVLGAHPDESRPANYVPAYLHDRGYRVLPVNALNAGSTLFDQPVRAALPELGEAVDVVDVFRRASALDGHLDEILQMSPRPRLVWLQQGIRDDAFAGRLLEAGIDVVQDRCMLADHRRLMG